MENRIETIKKLRLLIVRAGVFFMLFLFFLLVRQCTLLLPSQEEAQAARADQCLIECGRAPEATAVRQGEPLCLTRLDKGNNKEDFCLHPTEIIMVSIEAGCITLYDYSGEGHCIQENLTQIESQLLPEYNFLRVSARVLVNMTYAWGLDRCERDLKLAEELNCYIPRDKLKQVEQKFHESCTIIGS